jgi:N-acetylmuramoyl-L-alanine amidase
MRTSRLSRAGKVLVCSILSAVAVVLTLATSESRETTVKRPIGTRASVVIQSGRNIYLEMDRTATPLREEAVTPYLETPALWKTFVRGNVGRIPYGSLNNATRRSAIAVLFPDDYWSAQGWVHFVAYGPETGGGETLWSIAEWFTGKGNQYRAIKTANNKRRNVLYNGEKILIPKQLLLSAFVNKSDKPPYIGMTVDELTYKSDSQGEYAVYKLKRGETLYSDVVGQFTSRTENEDVRTAVRTIASRSGIRNPNRVDIGQEVRIPLELLATRYRPYGDPGRTRLDASERIVGVKPSRVHATELDGVYVILDAGHGGRDPGKMGRYNTQEDDYVYDVMCRVKRLLETRTRAKTIATIIDKSSGYTPIDRDSLRRDSDEYLLTRPEYANTNATVSVHLRWYLANSKYRELLRKGVKPENVVFTSFHADSRWSTMRGSMVYYPSAYHCRGRYGKSGSIYTKYAEVRERKTVSFSQRDRLKAQQESKRFADEIIKGLRRKNVAIHKSEPVRWVVHRSGREYVPAVLRYNEVPKRVLIEVLNLNNSTDCARIKSWKFRERVAEAYVDSLVKMYAS